MNVKLRILTAGVLFFTGQAVVAQKDTTKTVHIEEVVVVAYGKQKKETVVGSNVQIDAKQIESRAISNVAQAIDGAAAGIQIASSSGQPGSTPTVRIRGVGSFSASNEPLYIVDGTPFPNGIESLNPNDILAINVLKDAASTSLYGSSAANGVVMITTKKGRKGKDKINFSASTGVSERSVAQYDRLDASQYYPIVWESLRNGVLGTTTAPTLAQANTYASNNLITLLKNNVYNVADNLLVTNGVLNPSATLKYTDLDWDQEVAKTGFRQNYDLNYSGGNDKTTYFASLGYLDETGYYINSDFERLSARLNVDSQLKDWLKISLSVSGSNSNGNNAVDGANNNSSIINPYYFTRRMGPIYSPYLHDANGNNIIDANGDKVFDLGQTRGGDAYSGRHTIAENLMNIDFSRIYNLNTRFTTEFKLMKDLTLTVNAGYDTRNRNNKGYTNKIIGDAAPDGAASRTNSVIETVTFNQILNYRKSFGSHNFDIIGGHESYKFRYEYLYGYKKGQSLDGIDDLINFITPTSLTSYTDNYRKESYFGRVNYDFNEKYLLSASIRRDGSSKFSPDSRWANFWSVGAGWRINKENFLGNISFIDELKLRGSYGEVGNDGLLKPTGGDNYYPYQSLFDLGYNNGAETGIIIGNVSDPDIKWETNKQMDLALDFGFLNKRISGSVEVYKRETLDMLFNVPQSLILGIPNASISQNIGNMNNKGIEIGLNLVPIRTENIQLDVFINASKFKNEVTKLPDGQETIINGTKQIKVGQSLYDFWLRQWYGVDPADGAGLFLLSDALVGTTAADIRVVNGVNVTTSSAKAKYDYSGSAIPDWYGSFGANFKIKSFYLNSLFTYSVGSKIYDSNYAQLMSGYPQGIALSTDILERWQKPGDITNVPLLTTANSYVQYAAASTRWLTSGDYINFRSVTLGYDFNSPVLQQLNINSLKLYVNGENIWAKTSRKGLEPQENFSGTNTNRYSPSRIFSLGLNVSF